MTPDVVALAGIDRPAILTQFLGDIATEVLEPTIRLAFEIGMASDDRSLLEIADDTGQFDHFRRGLIGLDTHGPHLQGNEQ